MCGLVYSHKREKSVQKESEKIGFRATHNKVSRTCTPELDTPSLGRRWAARLRERNLKTRSPVTGVTKSHKYFFLNTHDWGDSFAEKYSQQYCRSKSTTERPTDFSVDSEAYSEMLASTPWRDATGEKK